MVHLGNGQQLLPWIFSLQWLEHKRWRSTITLVAVIVDHGQSKSGKSLGWKLDLSKWLICIFLNCCITIIGCREWSQCLENEKPFLRGSQAQKKFVHLMNEWKCSVVSPSRLILKEFWLLCSWMQQLQVRLCSMHSLFAPSLSFKQNIFYRTAVLYYRCCLDRSWSTCRAWAVLWELVYLWSNVTDLHLGWIWFSVSTNDRITILHQVLTSSLQNWLH